MKLLISDEEYKKLSGNKMVPCLCLLCNKQFSRKKWIIEKSLRQSGKSGYCSRTCSNKSKTNRIELPCEECGKITQKAAWHITRYKHFFCSYACHAKYKNRTKQHGVRRSTIEDYIESMICETFPSIQLLCNDTVILGGLELDFYFPMLKFAIELNGITHYEPIYGEDRFTRSQDSDKRKMISCYEKGIELAVIDVSGAKCLTKKWKSIYWQEVHTLLDKILPDLDK